MSRTDLDPATLAASLRRMAGDGSVEWVTEPMQTCVLLDVADMLDENVKLWDENELLQAHVRSLQRARMLDWNERERLSEFIVSFADAFNISGEWADVRWCLSGCMHLFKCHPTDDQAKIRCPAWARMRELGVEVD